MAKSRLAPAALVMSLFTFLGPGVHTAISPDLSPADRAIDGGIVGIMAGIAGIVLAMMVLRQPSQPETQKARSTAITAIVISSVGIVVWAGAFALMMMR